MNTTTTAAQNNPASGQRSDIDTARPNSTIRLGPSIRNSASEAPS